MAKTAELKEKVAKEALENLDWPKLKTHLDKIVLDEDKFSVLLGHIRRARSLVMAYPDAKREKQREEFLGRLQDYAHAKLGQSALQLAQEGALLNKIERGYRSILELLQQCDISKLPADVRTAAYITRAAHQCDLVTRSLHDALKARKEIGLPPGVLLRDENGAPFSPDAVITTIVECLTMTLVMEAYKNKWFDAERNVVLPILPTVADQERYKAGSTEVLAQCWRRWRRTEQRRRFLGGEFEERSKPDLPNGMPKVIERLTIYNPPKTEIFDHVANERLNDRLGQTFMEMLVETNLQEKAAGIKHKVALPPSGMISAEEGHSGVSLSEIVSYSIVEDQERPGGLRLLEWIRAYCVLQQLARDRESQDNSSGNLVFVIPRDELISILKRCGLSQQSALRFVVAAALNESSADLFDGPLIKMQDGSLLVFGPALISANPARVVLSIIATLGEPLARKGKAFEADILSFLKKETLQAQTFKVKRDGEEYEYDVVLCWGDYIFIFECKNHSLSNHHPIQAYYFELEMRSNAKQVMRLADALRRYPDILSQKMQVDATTKTIVPCVLNALPFSLPSPIDGVYFTDASVLKRFFQEKYFHVNTPYRIDENVQLLHRTAMHSLWAGDQPTPADYLKQLREPFQVNLMLAHAELGSVPFPISSTELVVAGEFTRTEMSIESYADLVGASSTSIRKTELAIAKQVKKLRAKAKKLRTRNPGRKR
jgi:hypothetical protein